MQRLQLINLMKYFAGDLAAVLGRPLPRVATKVGDGDCRYLLGTRLLRLGLPRLSTSAIGNSIGRLGRPIAPLPFLAAEATPSSSAGGAAATWAPLFWAAGLTISSLAWSPSARALATAWPSSTLFLHGLHLNWSSALNLFSDHAFDVISSIRPNIRFQCMLCFLIFNDMSHKNSYRCI